jgi:hypothetical protein
LPPPNCLSAQCGVIRTRNTRLELLTSAKRTLLAIDAMADHDTKYNHISTIERPCCMIPKFADSRPVQDWEV